MEKVALRIVQISDTHLFSDTQKALLGVKTDESFRALVNLLKTNNPQPHFILLTGDLSQDGSESSYRRVADELSAFNVPVYCIPGNHDDNLVMQTVYPRGMFSLQKQLIIDGWQFILLDSHIPRRVEGRLEQTELDFMVDCLKAHPDLKSVIVFHHQPLPVGCGWLDKLGLTNADEFWKAIASFSHVRAILFGHVHQQVEGIKNGVPYYSTPSTCIQFKRKVDKFALEELSPAYRVIDFYPNGEIKTKVFRLDHYVGTFEPHAKGY